MANALTINETMSALKCSRSFVYTLFSAGELTRIKLGRRTLVSAESVERLLTEGTSPSFADAS